MAKKIIFSLLSLFMILSIPAVLASFEVQKEAVAGTIIKEFNSPAVFNITIINKGSSQNFLFDTLLDITIQPSSSFMINSGEEKSVLLKAFFSDNLKRKYYGGFDFAYFIKSSSGEIFEDDLSIRIVPFENVVSVLVPESIGIKDDNVIITIQNQESVIIDMDVRIESELFEGYETISLIPFESREIIINIDPEKIWKDAGTYEVVVTFSSESNKVEFKDNIELNEFKDVSVEEDELNLLFYKKKTITKTITGNVIQTVSTEIEKTPFEKAFTSFNSEPDYVNEEGNELVYKWQKDLKLGESLVVTSTTNFILPLLMLLLIFVGSVFYVSRSGRRIIIKKRAVRARTSTGDFVVKIVTTIKNNGVDATDVKLIDKLPVLTNLHERFGVIRPDEIEKDKVVYNIGSLNKGEMKLFSYIVHSDVKVLGKRVIPRATAHYTIGNERKTSFSNEVFLVS